MENRHLEELIKKLKAAGLQFSAIAAKLSISRELLHYYVYKHPSALVTEQIIKAADSIVDELVNAIDAADRAIKSENENKNSKNVNQNSENVNQKSED